MRELGDVEFVAEWFGFFGLSKGVPLFGWLVAVGLMAPPDADRAWVLAHGLRSQATRYRNVDECEEFIAHLRARGLSVGGGVPGADALGLLGAA